jgi:heavy metal sensor kinase
MKHLGIRAKLTLSYAALFALVLMCVEGIIYRTVSVRLDQTVNERLEQFATGVWGHVKLRDGQPTLADDSDDYFVRTGYFELYDGKSGHLVARSIDNVAKDSAVISLILNPEQAKNRVKAPGIDEVDAGGTRLRFHNSVFRAAQSPYLLRVAVPLTAMAAARQELINTFLFTFPAVVLIAAAAGWLMAGSALKPVGALRTAAHQIGISQLNRRLPLRGTGDELDSMANTFNQVFARLEEAVAKMKQFTASISHELRTPLAVLQGEAEMALMRPELPEEYRRVLASQLEEFQKLNRLINRLLELARAEAGDIQLTNQEFELAELLRSLGEQMEPIATSKRVSLEVKCADSIQVTGDPQWLERVILNLLDNAIKFTPEGGKVSVSATAGEERVAVEVSDTGIGISQEALPNIFERFFRVDPSRSKQVEGVGLGLTIVKWIVEAHHGTIAVKSEPGVGSCFTVLLPVTAPVGVSAHA